MILREIKNIFIKNRLTEGVDFVRKEWLISNSENNSTPFIDTLIPPQLNQVISFTFKVINSTTNGNEPGVYGAMSLSTWQTCLIRCFRRFGTDNYIRLEYNNNNNDTGEGSMFIKEQFLRGKEYACSLSINSSTTALGVINNNSKQLIANSNVSLNLDPQPTHCIFTQVHNAKWSFKSVGFRNFNITNLISLIPCQLLKSIPASLDANNIARSAGECGMYDSISGKFYGNVANSGTFTVEGEVEPETHTGLQQIYQNKLIEGVDYETADWLKMDIPESIIIDMMSLPINSNNVEFKRNWIQITNSEYFRTSNYIYYITDYGDANDLCPMVWKITPSQFQYIGNIKLGLGLHTIITNSNGVTISGNYKVASLSWYGNPITYMTFNSMMIFNKHTIHLTSSIKVDGVTRYVPCKLLKPIPRNLDANNIARSAGDCGMIDLISGKFYGNVASNGTFTVENDNNE